MDRLEDVSSPSQEARAELVSTAPSINITASTPTLSTSEPRPSPLPDSPTPSRKPSWFGSLSRARGRAKADQLQPRAITSIEPVGAAEPNPPPAAPAVNPPATAPIDAAAMPLPPSQPPTPIPSPPRPVPRQPTSKRSWFSSPLPHTPERTSSAPSSIDEEVPTIATFTPLSSSPTSIATHAVVTSPSNDHTTGRPRLSSLNPSTSRFTLSIPLLGRPKVPIDQVSTDVLDPKATSESLPAPTEPISTPETASAPISVPEIAVVTPDPTPIPDLPPVTAEENNNQSSPATSTIQTSSSWWSYVGWSSSPMVTVSVPEESVVPSSRDPSPTPTVRCPTPPQTTEPTSDPNLDLVPSVQSPSESIESTTTPRPDSGDAEGDVLPASSSSWYNPWAWYSSASTSTLVPTPATPSSTATEVTCVPAEKPETETITGPALTSTNEAEGAPRAPTETPKVQELEQSPRLLNPVEATITMNRSGWASFFSSRSLIMKTITAPPARDVERDENGMEVMDVPDDEPQQHPQAQLQVPAETRGRDAIVKGSTPPAEKSGEKEKKPSDNAATPSTSRSSSKAPAPNLKGKAPPLIIADSIKFTPASTSARSSSPVPSMKKPPSPSPSVNTTPASTSTSTSTAQPLTKSKSKSQPSSGSNTPSRPSRIPPPNLILPTWSDTFHTIPRSQVPPPPQAGSEGAFSKTMRLVSGVLFAGDEGAQASSDADADKEQEKQRRQRAELLKHFGKELPRAYDVVNPPPPPLSASTSGSRWGLGKGKGKERATIEVKEDVLRGCKRVVVIGVHGWFPGAVMRSVIGEGFLGVPYSVKVQILFGIWS
ncbi:hypothetical protein C0992_003042 [Termitomyces sp. T32_za158]|nr:hypothetical protein C0992_003042 [Termitomyces sp. T32_za158]